MNDPTGFWAERNFEPNVEKNYHGSVYVVHGLQDWNVHSNVVLPWVDSLNLSTKILLGQWDHAYPDRPQFNVHATRYDWAESLLHWFDRYLRNDTTAVTGPRVDVEDNRGEWRTETSFPPTDARFATFYLASGQTLADAPGGSGQVLIGGLPAGTETGIVPVPAPVSPPPGTTTRDAWFTTGPLASDLRFSGLPQVPLTVTPLGPGGHVRVELYDISPNGSQLLVGHGYMDLRFAADSSKETPVVPGQPMLAPLQMMPLDVHVAAGHKLALRILQDAGFDPLPTDPIPFLLNFGSGTKSALRLPVINRTASDLAGGWPYGPKAGLSKPSGGTGDFPLSLGSGAP
jgi:X-Pro dipeptidyl-peptidase